MPSKPKQPSSAPSDPVRGYSHDDAKRKHLPPAGIAAQGTIQKASKQQYEYNPHLPPVLRFGGNGAADQLADLIREAGTHPLTFEE